MNKTVSMVHDALQKRELTPTAYELPNGTLLSFTYNSVVRFISGVSPDITSSTGRNIADIKHISTSVAQGLGMSTPDTILHETDEVSHAFLRKHGRVVVKPVDGAHGKGVSLNIVTEKALKTAVERARAMSATVVLQQQVAGSDVRVLVIGNDIVAVTQRVPASVVGDGSSTVRQLIELENQNTLRGENYEKPMNKIDMAASRAYLGDELESVPLNGETKRVIDVCNIGAGGKAINLEDNVPQKLLDEARRYCQATGLFCAGVDFMYDSMSDSWYFVEANSSPSFGLHMWPAEGKAVNVADIYVTKLLAAYNRATVLNEIGRNASIDFDHGIKGVPAKIDTGADSSSVWASNITVNEHGELSFCLFDKGSPHYTGEVLTRQKYRAVIVRSASGHVQLRYNTQFTIRLNGKRILASFNLSDRSKNTFPVLIGRKTLNGKFVVNVQKNNYAKTLRKSKGLGKLLNDELAQDKHAFHLKYYGKDVEDV